MTELTGPGRPQRDQQLSGFEKAPSATPMRSRQYVRSRTWLKPEQVVAR